MENRKAAAFGKKRSAKKQTLKEAGFYHSKVWRKKRDDILRRDHYLCQLRLSPKCTRIATEVHHIKPLEEYPDLALVDSNLMSVCWTCHELTKSRGSRPLPPAGVRVIKL